MWLKYFFKSLISTSSRRRLPDCRPSSARPCLEALEDRCVPSYWITDLGSLGGNWSQANDLNTSGQAVGSSTLANGSTHAFLWQNGIMTDLGTLGAGFSEALAINDAGQIVGRSVTGDGTYHAFLLTPEDTDGNGDPDRWFRDSGGNGKNDLMLDLGPNSIANNVNNAGQVVGNLRFGATDQHGFLWQNGVTTDLGAPGGLSSSATAINDAGQVTGFVTTETGSRSAFLWQGDGAYDIGASSAANAINESGQVAGTGPYGAILWTPATPNGTTGSLVNLGTLPASYGSYGYTTFYSAAADVNDLGSVVGRSTTTYEGGDSDGGWYFESSRAFLWSDGVIQELDSGLNVPLYDATAINNAGQIVANGQDSLVAPWNEWANRGFLLTPVTGPLLPFVSIDDVTITEGNSGTSPAVFTVRLSEASSRTVAVEFATGLDGSANIGGDYQEASGTLTFAPGETQKTITVLVIGDRRGEPNETFVVNLNARNLTISDGQGVCTIVDDEPRISIGEVTKAEGKKGNRTLFTFTVTLSAAYDQPVSVSFRTADGTATTGDGDYVAQTGTLTFRPGETTKTITIVVNGDMKREADEYFYVDLFNNSVNSLFTTYQGIGTILNDD